MKIASYIAGLVGLALLTGLMLHQGLGGVLHVLGEGGWALLWLVPFHALPLLLDAQGWRVLLAPRDPDNRAGLPFLFWVATVREAANRLLPTANIGGEVVGIRLAKWRVPDGAAVTASVIIEVLLTVINQYLFSALGLVLLIAATQATRQTWTIVTGLVLSLPVPILLGALLRYGKVFERMERLAEHMLGDRGKLSALIGGSNLDAEIRALYAHHGRLLAALGWQLAGYILGSFETWLALYLLGHPIGAWTAIAIEAMTQAIRHFVFIVPAGIGVQEAGLVLFGHMVGVGNDVALSLSLAKRAREVLFGTPALLSWQWLEGRRLHQALNGRAQAPGAPSSS
ncbi:MAG: lysylphosphatidylglycerol synthase domain-containing protein [Nevskia sp.]|nr:lysylphosphatidylglycerol synthase domain-containing protein [Nevskia sp.]